MSIQGSINQLLAIGAGAKKIAATGTDISKPKRSASQMGQQAMARMQENGQANIKQRQEYEALKSKIKSNYSDIGMLAPYAQKEAIKQLPELQEMLKRSKELESK